MLHMKCYTEVPNVGDSFGVALAERRFGGEIVAEGEVRLNKPNLILAGSIMHWADAHSIVCGAGFLMGSLRPMDIPRRVIAVRGPLTAAALRGIGIACPNVFGDPGILAPTLFPQGVEPDLPLGIVPHYVDLNAPWLQRCRALGVPVLDVRQPVGAFLAGLQRCQTVLSSSLHGIIFAHAYGRRALWLELSGGLHGDGFKFFDYYASIGVASSQVVRCVVAPAADPTQLARLATPGDTTQLVPGLERAIAEAAIALEEASSPFAPDGEPAPSGWRPGSGESRPEGRQSSNSDHA